MDHPSQTPRLPAGCHVSSIHWYAVDRYWDTMPFRYNFVNDERYLPRYQADLDDLRIMHFLDSQTIHKDRTFDSVETVESTLSRTYETKVDQRFAELLAAVHRRVESES